MRGFFHLQIFSLLPPISVFFIYLTTLLLLIIFPLSSLSLSLPPSLFSLFHLFPPSPHNLTVSSFLLQPLFCNCVLSCSFTYLFSPLSFPFPLFNSPISLSLRCVSNHPSLSSLFLQFISLTTPYYIILIFLAYFPSLSLPSLSPSSSPLLLIIAHAHVDCHL